jgi:hypothetical protein
MSVKSGWGESKCLPLYTSTLLLRSYLTKQHISKTRFVTQVLESIRWYFRTVDRRHLQYHFMFILFTSSNQLYGIFYPVGSLSIKKKLKKSIAKGTSNN